MVIQGRTVRWKSWGIEWEADEKHRRQLIEQFGYDAKTKSLNANGDSEDHINEDWELEELVRGEATEFRAATARLNFLSQDSPRVNVPSERD